MIDIEVAEVLRWAVCEHATSSLPTIPERSTVANKRLSQRRLPTIYCTRLPHRAGSPKCATQCVVCVRHGTVALKKVGLIDTCLPQYIESSKAQHIFPSICFATSKISRFVCLCFGCGCSQAPTSLPRTCRREFQGSIISVASRYTRFYGSRVT